MGALVALQGVRPYVYISIAPSGSQLRRDATCARTVCHKMNNLALTVTLPWVQQAICGESITYNLEPMYTSTHS